MTVFENRLAEATRAGRAAGESAAGSGKYTKQELRDLTPDDEGFTSTEILLKITGEKSLHDPEEADAIVGVFEDNFYDAIAEYEED